MNPLSTLHVVECFPNLMLKLLTLSISYNDDEKSNATGDSNFTHQLNCVVLGKTVLSHPDVLK